MLQPTETVTRPDPGLARGKWEAPAWAFWVALAVIVVGTTLYVLRRLGMLRFSSSGQRGKGPHS
ncbi:MAG: hypothetical protein JWP87_6208 [Labilithrix sp.]|nr:hypothetical protein [Labilithrix sp.]